MTTRIDINADIAESFGRWSLGEDAELVGLVTTVNVACGWHGGDPSTMHRAVDMAAQAGVNIGAHPGFPDLLGFGRRPIVIDDADAVDYVLYQVGALMGIASRFDVTLSHVKPHGAFYGSIVASPERAVRIARNMIACGVPDLRIIVDHAPMALNGLEQPHAIFIGGGGSDPGVLDAAIVALRPGGRLVANAVTLELEALLLARHASLGGSLTRLSVERADAVGSMTAWRPAMPIVQWAWVKP